jgi:hypothetical protein
MVKLYSVKLLAFREVRWLIAGVIVVVAAAVAAGLLFTSGGGSASPATAFSAASISLTLNDQTGQLAFTNLSFDDMTPGSEVYAPLEVGNTGPVPLKYSMSSVQSGDALFGDALSVGIAAVKDGTCTSGSYQGGAPVYADAVGLSNAAIAGRALPPGGREYLCFHVRLPSGAASGLADQSAAATFSFTAQS